MTLWKIEKKEGNDKRRNKEMPYYVDEKRKKGMAYRK